MSALPFPWRLIRRLCRRHPFGIIFLGLLISSQIKQGCLRESPAQMRIAYAPPTGSITLTGRGFLALNQPRVRAKLAQGRKPGYIMDLIEHGQSLPSRISLPANTSKRCIPRRPPGLPEKERSLLKNDPDGRGYFYDILSWLYHPG